jgi:AraC-like DNA-binding protein
MLYHRPQMTFVPPVPQWYDVLVSEFGPSPGLYGSVNLVRPLLDYLKKVGVDPKAILDRAGIPPSALDGAKGRFPKREFQRLWQVASEATGDPAIALRVSTMVRTDTLGIIGHLVLESESRRKAFERARELSPLLWGEGFECEFETKGEVAFMRCNTERDPYAGRFITEYAVGIVVSIGRAIETDDSGPVEARFSYPAPPYADEYERILRVPVRFDAGENGVLFRMPAIDTLNPAADAILRRLLERYADEQLARMPPGASFSQRVRSCIRSMLPAGGLTAEIVARQLHASERTLRRRLKDEGTSYQEILQEVRIELACHYLTKEKREIVDVALILGFSDQSAFTKAFRHWTGQTPADFVRANSR